jgi:hypothetical protein
MRTTAIGLLLVFCLIGCGADVEKNVELHYFVRNDTTVTVSMYAVSVETTLAYVDMGPGQRTKVAHDETFFNDGDLRFFESDSILIRHGGTLLDIYRAGETRHGKKIMVRSDYEVTSRTETDVEYVFGLFSE